MNIPAVNFHVYKPCNAKCRFCFATFRDVHGQLSLSDAISVLDALRGAGAEKINFAGGEPTLHPQIGELVAHARGLGLVTSIVTNGARLAELLDSHSDDIDWVGLSVDSADEAVERALGRSRGAYIAQAVALADRCRGNFIRVKLNTVVSKLNWMEDMSPLVRRVRPERWKVFQVLPVEGQNDGGVESLLVSSAEFAAFVSRHEGLHDEGLGPVVEDNDAMRGSYVMVDPLGRFYGNSTGRHVYSDPILKVGVEQALAQVGFSSEKFAARGGSYRW